MYSGHSTLTPEKLVRIARKRGLEACAITDHDEIKGAFEVSKLMPTIIGEEVSTAEGDMIGLFVNELIGQGPALEVIDRIHGQGALVVVPHPFDSLRREALNSEEIGEKADLIEVFNGRVVLAKDNRRAEAFALEKGIPGIVGSDAHTGIEVGRCWMELESISSPSEFMRSVKSARHHAQKSPFYVHGITKLLKLRGA